MIPLTIPNLSGREAQYLQECVQTNFVSSVGEFVTKFEALVAKAAGSLTATATSSGTTGLHAALVAAGVCRDDLVLLPDFTFIAGANAIAHCGAMPWLIDIDAETWTLNPELLRLTLQDQTTRSNGEVMHRASGRRVAALMPVYTMGIPADMDALRSIARAYGLPVIADGAAALGARYKGRHLVELADLTVFSFNGNKTVTCGGGGAVVGDEHLVLLVKHLSATARVGRDYHHDRIGFNYRMTNIEAAVGCAQMERLDEFVVAKQRIRKRYDMALGHLQGVRAFPQPSWAQSACWLSGVLLPKHIRIAEVCDFLKGREIEARPFWEPIHLQPPYIQSPRALNGVTEDLWKRVLVLPCSTSLSEMDQDFVIVVLKEFLHAHPA